MKAESLMWRKLRPVLMAAKLDPVRVENPIHPGTPDVNIVGRWIELKCLPGWPVRDTTLVKIPHFTPQQRVWLYRRWRCAPGTTLLVLEIQSERRWLVFDGDVAAKVVGRVPKSLLRASARTILAEHDLPELPKVFAQIDTAVRQQEAAAR